MELTTNLNLKKPDYIDPVDIQDINDNMDTIDSAIQSKANSSQVLTNVPVGAKFTDTNTITTINGKTGAIAKADITALGIPAQDTVYTHPTGTNPHGTTKTDVVLGNVDNVKQMPIAGGTFIGQTKFANDTSYGVFKGRNIASGTTVPSGGSNGDIYFKRKV